MNPLPSPHSEIVSRIVLPAILIMAAIAGWFFGFAVLLKSWEFDSFMATLIALLLTYAAVGFAFFTVIRLGHGRKRPGLRQFNRR